MATRVVNNMGSFSRANEKAMESALARMRNDIFVLSQFKVPYEGGELKSSGQQLQVGRLHHRVQYGETGAEAYAGYQHRGMRKDGSHVVRNYTTSGTQKNYLGESGAIIVTKVAGYFKRAAESVRV
jgi:hypothetical protein